MRLKTFRAFSLSEALDAVQQDLGPTAAILHTRTFKQGGFLGLGGRDVVEVIASETTDEVGDSDPTDVPAGAPDATSTPTTERSLAARRAYARRDGDDAAVPSARSGTLEVDRDRTRRLAQAMAVRLEKQQAARRAAGVTSGGDLVTGPDRSGAEPGVDAASEVDSDPQVSAVDHPDTPVPAEGTESSAPVDRFIIGEGGILIPDVPSDPATETRMSSDTPADSKVVGSPSPLEVLADVDSNSTPDATASAEAPRVVCLDDGPVETASTSGMPMVSSASESETPEPSSSPKTSDVSEDADGPNELDAIRNTVGRLLDPQGPEVRAVASPQSVADPLADPLAGAYATLIGQELSRDLADQVVSTLESSLDPSIRRDPVQVRDAVLRQVANLIPTEESIGWASPRDGRPRTIAFVGPTGVGKTTTLAKIAATLVLREKLSVGLVTSDTYRISAVDQLRTYADILGARMEVAADPQGMREAMARCSDLDAVLVDTPGRSQNDADRLSELRGLMDAAQPHETHLVLSGTASERVLLREADAFSQLGPDRVVLTKLDEAVAFGMLVSVVRRIGRRISWVTTGQEVPRDVEHATGERLASLVLGGAVR